MDAVGLLPIFTAAWVRHADDLARVLVVGENSFEYSQALRRTLGAEYDIVATSLESADKLVQLGFKIPQDAPGLKILHKVDARDLGRHFGPNEFDVIIFNNPRALTGNRWRKATGELVQDVLDSAPDVLKASGEVHFGLPQGGLAGPRLGTLTRSGGYGRFAALSKKPIPFYESTFGVFYEPLSNTGRKLPFGVDVMYWYRFTLTP